jgi:polysaccharide chain length determinant protein (PEP-CTERM system associated)
VSDPRTDEVNPQQLLADVFRTIRLRKYWLLVPTLVLGTVAVVGATLLPATYRSQGTILVEKPNVPADLVESTIAANVDDQIEKIRREFITRDKLLALMEKYELYAELRAQDQVSAALGRMREDLTVEVLQTGRRDPTVAFEVAFHYADPDKAYKVAQLFADWYLTENARARQEKARDTADFLQQQTRALAQEVSRLERRFSVFKEEHAGRLPNQIELKTGQLRDANRQLRELNVEKQNLSDRRSDLVRRRAVARGDGAKIASPIGQRLADLEQERDRLRVRLTDEHPDVLAIDHEIEVLAERASDVEAMRDTPEVRELDDQIAMLDRQVASLDRRRALVSEEIEGLEADLKHAGSIADEYRALQREYDSAVSDYGILRRKQLTADMGASLELNEKGERFTLIEPPRRPAGAESPNRKLIAAGGLMGSFGIGSGLLLLMALLDRTVAGPRALEKLAGAPPLIVVPTMRTRADRQRAWAGWLAALAAAAAALWAVDAYLLPLQPLIDGLLARVGVEEGAALPSQAGG